MAFHFHLRHTRGVAKIDLFYDWKLKSDAADRSEFPLHNSLMNLLQAVRKEGSIGAAAKSLNLSYRHVWGELKKWELQLGQDLIVWDKGQPARLSIFGDKLLWTERQTQARIAPQIESIRADLERAMSLALNPNAHVLSLHASHDDALSIFRDHVSQQGLHLDLKFNGSLDALHDLNEGRCTIAGFHTLANVPSPSHIANAYKPLLKPGLHKLIGFSARQQGLITTQGNPFKLQTLADVLRSRARFANRDIGTGTRVLLDHWLSANKRKASELNGYDHIEKSHAAVAERVASGQADVGLGTQLAAYKRGLCFVPWVEERYYFVCLKSAVDDPAILKMQESLGSPNWLAILEKLQGYSPHAPGQVLSLRQELPWWQYKKPKN